MSAFTIADEMVSSVQGLTDFSGSNCLPLAGFEAQTP